ncbi:MAG: hypothetical protein HC849_12355 [Oscillatoriales cyanobacterium RU_3_3]|nr:hypothetical protein [Microcoleus sp. SU_5_6]NJM60822.1 hypothetical protein [Oscillatoriales cyanobacterium RU_3_3]NJR25119.1 hypothetical protein [Richelia sp. CSU_2_1]
MSFELRTVFNSKLKTQNSKLLTNYQTVNCQLSTVNCQLSTINYLLNFGRRWRASLEFPIALI